MSKLIRVSQMPPGMPPMPPGMPTAPMAAPGGPPMPPATPKRQEIGSPLDTLAKVLYDFNIQEKIEQDGIGGEMGSSHTHDGFDHGIEGVRSWEKLANKVWQEYGGNEDGTVNDMNVGNRVDQENVSPEDQEKEHAETDDRKWLRLPKGQTIADLTSVDELSNVLRGMTLGITKNMAKQQQGGAGGGPGGPPPGPGGPPPGGPPPGPMADSKAWTRIASAKEMLKAAKVLEGNGRYEQADYIISLLIE